MSATSTGEAGPSGQDGPERTRARILAAAQAIIAEEGFHRLSLERVAERAGVVRATIYYQFGSRTGLLEGLIGAAEERGEVHRTREEDRTVRDLYNRVMRIWEADAELLRGFMAMEADDEETRAVVRRHREGRRQRLVELVEDIERAGQLRVDPDDAVDLLWLLTSFPAYDFLRQNTGRDMPDVRRLLEVLASTLVDEQALGGSPLP